MRRIVDVDRAIVARQRRWLMKLNYIQMLREVGVHFSLTRC
jgi:tyrosyl-tRNA synthetase